MLKLVFSAVLQIINFAKRVPVLLIIIGLQLLLLYLLRHVHMCLAIILSVFIDRK